MESQVTDQKIAAVVAEIVRVHRPEKIILFGSYAWGKPNKDSDVDLFIVKDTDDVRETSRKISRLIFPRPFPLDVIVYNPESTKKRLAMGDVFVRDVFMNGKFLHGTN